MLDDPDFARSMGLAVGSMWLIEETEGNTIAEVREQERLYADLRAELTRKHQQLADVATARDFGLDVDATLWKGLSDYLARGGFEVPQYATVLKAAGEQAATQRFFHRDLEFPEVFFDRHGQPLSERGGFDAVSGNWISQPSGLRSRKSLSATFHSSTATIGRSGSRPAAPSIALAPKRSCGWRPS